MFTITRLNVTISISLRTHNYILQQLGVLRRDYNIGRISYSQYRNAFVELLNFVAKFHVILNDDRLDVNSRIHRNLVTSALFSRYSCALAC